MASTAPSSRNNNAKCLLLEDLEGLSVQEKLDIIEQNQKVLIRLFSEVVKVLEVVENKLCGREDGRLF